MRRISVIIMMLFSFSRSELLKDEMNLLSVVSGALSENFAIIRDYSILSVHNPSVIQNIEKIDFSFHYAKITSTLYPDFIYTFSQIIFPFYKNNAGIYLMQLTFGEKVYNITPFYRSDFVLGFIYGVKISLLKGGICMKSVYYSLPSLLQREYASEHRFPNLTYMSDIGISLPLFNKLNFEFSVLNFPLKFSHISSSISLVANVSSRLNLWDKFILKSSAEIANHGEEKSFNKMERLLGIEFSYQNSFYMRICYTNSKKNPYSRITLSAGTKINFVNINIGYKFPLKYDFKQEEAAAGVIIQL